MEFDIGELDFQASREGLSYVPQTLVAIENKLQALNARLADFVAEEADKIQNDWERAYYLFDKRRISLFANAVNKYATDKKFPLYDVLRHYGGVTLEHKVDDLAKDFNIQLRKFSISSHVNTCSKHESNRMDFGKKDATGRIEYESGWKIDVSSSITFVENDTKTGATERAKYHWRTKEKRSYTETVFVLEPVNRMQPMKVAEFYNAIHNPPEGQRVKASTLRMKDRATGGGMAKNVTILKMEERGGPRHYMKSRDLVWRDAGKAEDFDATLKHYYIPLSGFEPQWTKIKYNACGAVANMLEQSGISELQVVVYGVRKGDIEEIKKRSNWINLEEHIQAVFDKLGTKAFMACVREKLAINDIMKYNLDKIVDNIHVGPAYDLLKEFVGVPKSNNYRVMQELTSFFSPKYDLNAHTNKYLADIKAFNARYPLIEKLSHEAKETDIINYINLIDTVK
jgi:hypothetical protein